MSLLEKKYWKGLEEDTRSEEFPEELPLPMFYTKEESSLQANRRDFLKLLGFSFTGAALAACTRMPVEKAIPYLVKPEEITPGVANWYATTCAGCTAACPILAKVRDGRPIKMEGNPESTLTGGGLCAAGQAAVLSLYDDGRLKGPVLDGKEAAWEEIDARVSKEFGEISAQGGKIVILSGTIISPSNRALIGEWLKAFPGSEHIIYDAVSSSAILKANETSFGIGVLPRYRFDLAKTIVAFNADFLGTWISPVEFTKGWAANRKPPAMSRHIQFESRMSLTGSNADLRVPINPSEEISVAMMLANEISKLAGRGERPFAPTNLPVDKKIIRETADYLWKNRGQSLVVSGTDDIAVQTVVNAINSLLENIGKTVDLDNPSYQKQGDDGIARLLDGLERGEVQGLIVYGVNPAYDLADSKRFIEGLKKVRLVVSFADRLDETTALIHAVCPDHHFLESWNDANPAASFYSLTQPTIRPLHSTRAAQESLLKWMGRMEDFYAYLREYWSKNLFPQQSKFSDFDSFWDHAVHDGVFAVPGKMPEAWPFLGDIAAVGVQNFEPLPEGRFELQLYEKIAIRDGRHANNPWLQELPDPVTKITWDNYAQIAPAAAASLGLKEGDVVVLKMEKGRIEIPVQIQPGQAPRTISAAVGYGRTRCGKAGDRVGVNLFPFAAGVVALEKTGRHIDLAQTQTHHSMEGRPIVKETTLEEFLKNPAAGNEGHEKLVSLWAERDKEGHQWGMAIDLNACTGCSACIIGCQSENNVAVVGKDEVRRRREMHWIRIDRYYNGSEENPQTVHQPMMCQHCGHAPCETVCPVLATVHSSDGLNQQIYNRCVGTRYCANNCPYKVRRFNWFDYAHNDKFDFNMNSDLGTMVLNPDIVVRSRGVMEKCSLCVQRIQEGKLAAKREGRPLKDGGIQPACAQSCPTQAIVFGDLNEPGSRVAKLNKEGRFYHVLEELNVRPNVGYLTKVRNKT